MKNVTLSIPDELLSKSREYAKRHGTTLNKMIRELLSGRVERASDSIAESLIDHTERTAVSVEDYNWNREDAYER